MLDDFKTPELQKLLDFIGNGVRPIKAAKILFPNLKNKVKVTCLVRSYAWNKMTALNKDYLWETRKRYISIAAGIWTELPPEARALHYESIGEK